MRKLAALVRRTLLAVSMTILLVICVSRVEENTGFGMTLYKWLFISGGAYIIFSVISIIVRWFIRRRLDEDDAMKDTFIGVVICNGNSLVLNYFRRIAFWGTIMFLVNLRLLGVSSGQIYGGPYVSDVFLRGYHGFLLWSIVSLPLLFIITCLYFIFYQPHYGEGAYNIFQYIGRLFYADIITPFRVVRYFFSKDEDGNSDRTISRVLYFITLLIFVIINVVAIIKTIAI